MSIVRMSSSESKLSYPASPIKHSSDTSSVPTDLTVSSGENKKPSASIENSPLEENKLLKLEIRRKDAQIELIRSEFEEKLRQAEQSVKEANTARKVAEENSKLRQELQSGEMAKIQSAISVQLEEVTRRQHNLEDINQKLREKSDVAKTKLQSFKYDSSRYEQLRMLEPKDMSIFEFAELIIYKNVEPELNRMVRLEAYNAELNSKLNTIVNDVNRFNSTIQNQKLENERLNEELRFKDHEIIKIKETVKTIDHLNHSLENKVVDYEKVIKKLETNILRKDDEIEIYKKRLEELTQDLNKHAKGQVVFNETLVALRHEFSDIRLKFDGLELRSGKDLSILSSFTKQMQEKQLELLEELSTSIFQNNLDTKYREQYLTTIQELVTEQIRSQEYISRLMAERNKLQVQLDRTTAELADSKVEISDGKLRVQKERERHVEVSRELADLHRQHIAINSEVDVLKEKLAYTNSNLNFDVKKSKEYQTLLKDLKLLLSHRDEIQDMRKLIVKLQQD